MIDEDDVARDLVQRAHAAEVRPDFDVEAGVSDVLARAEAKILQFVIPVPVMSRIFLDAGNQTGMATIELDRLHLGVRDGHEPTISDALSGAPPQTPSEYRLRAMVLRRQLRYEEAFEVLLRGIADHDLDPALCWPVLYDLIVVLRLTRQDGVVERLIPLLAETAAVSADPGAVAAAVARLRADGAPSDAVSQQFDRRVQHVRQLIIKTRLEEATACWVSFAHERRLTAISPHGTWPPEN